MTFNVEKCWFLIGRHIGKYYIGKLLYHSKGGTLNVKFDWEEAVKTSVLGFYHTHIDGDPYLSDEDETTMKAWVRAEGRPMLCGVITETSQSCWIFYRKGKSVRHMRMVSILLGNIFIGWKKHKNEDS
jgi:hypothetical protein